MLGHHKVSLFGAGLVAVLVACHPATPVQSAISANAATQCADASTAPAGVSREDREVVGFAPRNATPAPCLTGHATKSAADVPNGDDPLWRLDMP
jgi:hypothetical protein